MVARPEVKCKLFPAAPFSLTLDETLKSRNLLVIAHQNLLYE